jgi:amino-acid N-acetyltransferase
MAGSTVRVISGNFITARPVGVVDGVDFQHSGLVRKVDVAGISRTLDFGAMVLMSPFGFSPTGEAFNLTMEEVATSVAIAMQADKLIFLTEIPASREAAGAESEDNPIDTELPLAPREQLLASLPPAQQPDRHRLLPAALREGLQGRRGAQPHHPVRVDGSLLLEVYVHDGIGTMVIDEKLEELREATADDVGGILQLIEPFERDGTLVKRDRTEIERDIANYTIIEHDGVIFACAALYPYPEARTGEMAALTVSPHSQGQGDGEKVLKRVEQRARAMGLESIFVLTTRTMHWFLKRGFVQVDPTGCPRRASASTTGTGAAWCSSRNSPERLRQGARRALACSLRASPVRGGCPNVSMALALDPPHYHLFNQNVQPQTDWSSSATSRPARATGATSKRIHEGVGFVRQAARAAHRGAAARSPTREHRQPSRRAVAGAAERRSAPRSKQVKAGGAQPARSRGRAAAGSSPHRTPPPYAELVERCADGAAAAARRRPSAKAEARAPTTLRPATTTRQARSCSTVIRCRSRSAHVPFFRP